MLETALSVMFWVTFSYLALASTVFLIRTAERSDDLIRAFRSIDDHSTDPESVSNRVFAISEEVGALKTFTYVFMLPVIASAVTALVASDALQSFAAIAFAAIALFAAVIMKRRLDAYYGSFHRCVGRTVREIVALDDAQAAYPSLMARPRRPSRPRH